MGYAAINNTNTKVKEPLDQTFIEPPEDSSFLDSLLNFEGWVEDFSLADVMNPSEEQPTNLEIIKEKEEGDDLGSSLIIEEGIGRVCITSSGGDDLKQETHVVSDGGAVKCVDDSEVKNGEDGEDSEEDESSESTSSSSSSSSDDDDEDESESSEEEEGLKGEVEMEEGEIRDEVVAWSDNDDEDGDTVKGPIRSKNEVQDLPPVPPVTVTIQPHHQTLPVGVVLSIMGSQVIVEGVEVHNPLSEGSILWITESRSPLGAVDEIFGPVKNPYYIVRYNSETEIPSGIQQGSLISFVPEFADYVLNSNNNLYKKGYDASGENDEELDDEIEFSDDEKEAEYKRMMKMAKRGSNGEKKKSRNRGGNRKYDQFSASGPSNGPTGGPSSGPASGPNNGSASGPSNGTASGPNNGPVIGPNNRPVIGPSNGTASGTNNGPVIGPNNGPITGPYAFPNIPSGVWPFGFPHIQPQNIRFPPFMQPNFIQQNPQFNTTPGQMMFPGNFVPPNFGAFASWPSGMPPPQNNSFNQSQVGPPIVFPQGGVAMPPNQLQMENNSNGAVRPPFVANGENSQNHPNQGNNRGGRKPFQRGGGRFRGGRSGPRSR